MREEFFFLQKSSIPTKEVYMTTKAYIMHELEGRGYSRFDQVPEEMFDYLPENMEQEDDDNFIIDEGSDSPWYTHFI